MFMLGKTLLLLLILLFWIEFKMKSEIEWKTEDKCALLVFKITMTIFFSWRHQSFLCVNIFSILCVSVADEEKLDERAKLSVAAKRSLFRVSCYPLPLSFYSYRLLLLDTKQRNVLPIKDSNAAAVSFFFHYRENSGWELGKSHNLV